MEVGVLGALNVCGSGHSFDVPGAMPRRLLALLAAQPGHEVTIAALVDGLWGEDPPATAETTVQSHVMRLRKALPHPTFVSRSVVGYRLEIDAEDVDAGRFARLMADGQDRFAVGDHGMAAGLLREALALWRGPAYAEFGSCEPLAAEAARLERMREDALELRIAADLGSPASASPSAELETLVRRNPTRENLWVLFMRSLYRDGRQADALAAYQRARALLIDQLGIEPGPALQETLQLVLTQDHALPAHRPDRLPAGASGDVAAAPHVERRQVSVVVAVLDHDEADVEEAEARLDNLRGEVARIAAAFGGVTTSTLGSRCVILFGAPTSHDDDAVRSVFLALQLRALDGFRCAAVTTGIALVTDLEINGRPLSTALTGADQGEHGTVVVDSGTRRLTDHLTTFHGTGDWSVVTGPAIGAAPVRPMSRSAFVGRTEERALVTASLGAVISSGRPTLVTIVGEAGMGKSRLVAEVCRDASPDISVVRTRCAPYGATSPLAPITELLYQWMGADSGDALHRRLTEVGGSAQAARWEPFVRPLLGHDTDAVPSRGRAFAAWSQIIGRLTGPGPTIVVVEDLHWASELVLDFVEYLLATPPDAPLLLLVTARPDLFDSRTTFPPAGTAAMTLRLGPLSLSQTAELVTSVLGDLHVDPAARERLVTRSAGIPLYAEELSRLIATSGLEGSSDVPDVLAGVLQARLDSLPPEQRRALQAASVAGDPFTVDQLSALLPRLAAAPQTISALAQRGFLTKSAEIDGWAVSHDLIRQTAYDRLTRAERARLHLEAARWWDLQTDDAAHRIDRLGADAATAFELAVALGDDETATAAQPLAVRGLLAAATPLRSVDVDTALALMQRALRIAEGSDLDTRALRARYCEVLTDHGDYELGSSIALDLLPALEEEMDPLLVDVSLALMLCQFNLGHDFTLTVDHLSEVLSGLPAGPDRARALGVVGMVQVMRQTPESMRQAIATGEEILRLGSAHGFELATAHMVRGRARLALGEADGMTELEDALHSMTALDSPFVMAGGWQWVAGASHHWRGPAAEWAAREYLAQLSSSRGIQSLVSMGAAEEVRVLAELGRLEDAIARADAMDVGTQSQLRWSIVQRALCLLDLGRLDALTADAVAATPWSEPGDMRHILGLALVAAGHAAHTGNLAQARQTITTLGPLQPFIDRDGAPELFPRLARTARTVGAPHLIAELAAIPTNGTPLRDHLRATLTGIAAATAGDLDTAIDALQAAADGWTDFGATYELAYAQAELADVLELCENPEHVALRMRAIAAFRAMGMPDRPWDLGPAR